MVHVFKKEFYGRIKLLFCGSNFCNHAPDLSILCTAKQRRDGFYREKKAVRPVRQGNEIKVPVKTCGRWFDGVDDNRNSSDLHADWLETDGGYLSDCFL